jgi:Ca2+-binding EF-hand superfamily protein
MKLKERFEVGSDNYVIDAEGLKKFFNCSDREVKVVMDMFDINGDYKIDAYEFMCAMAFMSHGTLDQKA